VLVFWSCVVRDRGRGGGGFLGAVVVEMAANFESILREDFGGVPRQLCGDFA
jgi:hypothetical protein